MDVKSKIENLLPGAWPKVIFLASLVLCIGLYKFFPDLPTSWLPQIESERFLIRILLSGSILLLGSVSLVALLMYHNKKLVQSSNAMKDYLIEKCANLAAQVNIYKESAAKSQDLAQRTVDTSNKTLAELKKQMEQLMSKHIEPAAASSASGPDDYHAPRQSFFGNDRPRRR